MDYSFVKRVEDIRHDKANPSPWLAMYLDHSIPFDKAAKAALIATMRSPSRQWLLPVARPLCRMAMAGIQVLKLFLPKNAAASKFVHWLISFGMRKFVSPEANYLILRHFHLGSEILNFIAKNVPGAKLTLNPLRPKKIRDMEDEFFLNHDLNLFNFVIDLNQQIEEKGLKLEFKKKLDLSMISDDDFEFENFPDTWHNFVDVQSAIEIYTPLFQLFLSDEDFWRASNSLQFDETIGIYCAKLAGIKDHLWLVNNKHPLIPLTTLQAGFRLMLHGLSTESLHALLRQARRLQKRPARVASKGRRLKKA